MGVSLVELGALEESGQPASEQILQVEEEVDERAEHENGYKDRSSSSFRLRLVVQYLVYVRFVFVARSIHAIVHTGEGTVGGGNQAKVDKVQQVHGETGDPQLQ